MKTTLEMVREFHDAFQVETPENPRLDRKDINDLRVKLLEEELGEFWEWLIAGDKAKTLDALCDLQYVLDGAFLALGFGRAKEEAFRRVHEANMTKLDQNGKPIFAANGKILKPKTFVHPDLSDLV